MLGYDYPLLGIFWTMLWFFLFFIWIWILITVFADIFRSHDIGGFAKALWVIFIIVLPFLGVLIYLIAAARACRTAPFNEPPGTSRSSADTSRTLPVALGQPISWPNWPI